MSLTRTCRDASSSSAYELTLYSLPATTAGKPVVTVTTIRLVQHVFNVGVCLRQAQGFVLLAGLPNPCWLTSLVE